MNERNGSTKEDAKNDTQKPRRKRPTIAEAEAREAEVRAEERACFNQDLENVLKHNESAVVGNIAFMALGMGFGVDTTSDLTAAIIKRQKVERVSGFIDALHTLGFPTYLTIRMVGKEISEARALLALYQDTSDDMQRQFKGKVDKVVSDVGKVAAAEKAAAETRTPSSLPEEPTR